MSAEGCAACGHDFVGRYLNALGKQWHMDCFTCVQCKQAFAGGAFVVLDGFPRCVTCVEGEGITVLGAEPDSPGLMPTTPTPRHQPSVFRPPPPRRSPPPRTGSPDTMTMTRERREQDAMFGDVDFDEGDDDRDHDSSSEDEVELCQDETDAGWDHQKEVVHQNRVNIQSRRQRNSMIMSGALNVFQESLADQKRAKRNQSRQIETLRVSESEEDTDEDVAMPNTPQLASHRPNPARSMTPEIRIDAPSRRPPLRIVTDPTVTNGVQADGTVVATVAHTVVSTAGGGDEAEDILEKDDGAAVQRMYTLMKEFHQNLTECFQSDPYVEAHFPENILVSLREMDRQAREVTMFLESDLEALGIGDTTDIEALVEWNRMDWSFDAQRVHDFRTYLLSRDLSKLAFTEWTMPRYLDKDAPLPSGSNLEHCDVAFVAEPEVTMKVSVLERADQALELAFEHFRDSLGPAAKKDAYVLKAFGFQEYFYGKEPLSEYAFVRSRVRSLKQRLLVLMLKPETKEELPYPTPVPAPMVPVAKSRLSLSTLDVPFTITIHRMESCNTTALPLLDGSVTNVFVTSFLFVGQQQIRGSVRVTGPVPKKDSAPAWNSKIKDRSRRGSQLKMKDLPRETRIAFLLYGANKANQTFLLGYATQQLIDHTGHLVQGSQALPLWGVTREQDELWHSVQHKKRSAIRTHYEYVKRKQLKKAKKKKHKAEMEARVDAMCEADLTNVALDPIFRASNLENRTNTTRAILHVALPMYKDTVYADRIAPLVPSKTLTKPWELKELVRLGYADDLERLNKLDPLYHLTPEDKEFMWNCRGVVSTNPRLLTLFLRCVDWSSLENRSEALRLMKTWPKPTAVNVLPLLGFEFQDATVRKFAVDVIRGLSNGEIQMYLLQLVQCIKAEPYHRSDLADLLVERAVAAPFQVGHYLFWHLKAELADIYYGERFALMLEYYLHHSPMSAMELRKQNSMVSKLQKISSRVMTRSQSGLQDKKDIKRMYTQELKKLNKEFFLRMPGGRFQLPLCPSWEATSLVVSRCNIMSSKMAPLWLIFENADAGAAPIYLIFKSGDDLRQDILTLQLLRIMDRLWLKDDLDMRLTPYAVIATGVNSEGKGMGMIEVVLESDTTSGIQMKYGGGAGGAFTEKPIREFLKAYNVSPSAFEGSVDMFMRSCAGYIVATSILGIGDRHNGNIMVTKAGNLFHIDFGHFLGNFKSKMGIKRERVAFVFTPDMAFVLGNESGQAFKQMRDLATAAFCSLRKRENSTAVENLFLLMVSAGMPELQCEVDVLYLKGRLRLDLTELKATKWMIKEIKGSLNSKFRQLDNWFHNKKHGV